MARTPTKLIDPVALITPSSSAPDEVIAVRTSTRAVLSILVPTRNEAPNILPLVSRLTASLASTDFDITFVDDSDDNTPNEIAALGLTSLVPIRLVHRRPAERLGGLGGAILEGIHATDSEWICVMEGDLQHPPELVDALLNTARAQGVDLILASRFCQGGGTGGLGGWRTIVSRSLITLSRLIFPGPLKHVSDPLTGFFLFRRDSVDTATLRPNGFKILLEILVRTPQLKVTEIPFNIEERHGGESKASTEELRRYFVLLARLRLRRFGDLWRFALVGLTGLLVNTGALAFFAEQVEIYYILAAVLATQCSTAWNFALSETWAFRKRTRERSRTFRFLIFAVVNNALLAARVPALFILVSFLGIYYLLANAVILLSMLLVRFVVADKWLWRAVP